MRFVIRPRKAPQRKAPQRKAPLRKAPQRKAESPKQRLLIPLRSDLLSVLPAYLANRRLFRDFTNVSMKHKGLFSEEQRGFPLTFPCQRHDGKDNGPGGGAPTLNSADSAFH